VVLPEPLGSAMTISLGRNGHFRFQQLGDLLASGGEDGLEVGLNDT